MVAVPEGSIPRASSPLARASASRRVTAAVKPANGAGTAASMLRRSIHRRAAGAGYDVLPQGVGDVEAEGDQLLQRRDARSGVPGVQLRPTGELRADDRECQLLLAGVMEVDGSAGPPRVVADLVDAGARVSLFDKKMCCGLQEHFSGCLRSVLHRRLTLGHMFDRCGAGLRRHSAVGGCGARRFYYSSTVPAGGRH